MGVQVGDGSWTPRSPSPSMRSTIPSSKLRRMPPTRASKKLESMQDSATLVKPLRRQSARTKSSLAARRRVSSPVEISTATPWLPTRSMLESLSRSSRTATLPSWRKASSTPLRHSPPWKGIRGGGPGMLPLHEDLRRASHPPAREEREGSPSFHRAELRHPGLLPEVVGRPRQHPPHHGAQEPGRQRLGAALSAALRPARLLRVTDGAHHPHPTHLQGSGLSRR